MSEGDPRLSFPLRQPELVRELARRLRRHSVNMINRSGSSHVGSSLSAADILAVLYGAILAVDPAAPQREDRDRFIMSKGHASAVYYAVLSERGFFPVELLDTFCENGAQLFGHVTDTGLPGIEVSTGSLGHGLPIGCGIALAAKRRHQTQRVFVLLSDGECDEGSTWEAVLFAPHHRLDNLIAIIDFNKIQSLGTVKEVLDLDPLVEKWRSFGWEVRDVDGHNVDDLLRELRAVPLAPERPTCIVAHTTKGKGVSFMENDLLWHYRSPQGEEFVSAMTELEKPL